MVSGFSPFTALLINSDASGVFHSAHVTSQIPILTVVSTIMFALSSLSATSLPRSGFPKPEVIRIGLGLNVPHQLT